MVFLGRAIVDPNGYTDCVDSDATVYPSASELCDGQYNNCDDPDYALNAAPDNESDWTVMVI